MYHNVPRISIFLLLVILLLLLSVCSQTEAVSGVWQAKISIPETGRSLTGLKISLTQAGSTIHGTILFDKQEGLPLVGTLRDGQLKLFTPRKEGLAVAITAKVENPQKISGKASLDYTIPNLGKKHDDGLFEMSR